MPCRCCKQQRPCSACTTVQADQGLCCLLCKFFRSFRSFDANREDSNTCITDKYKVYGIWAGQSDHWSGFGTISYGPAHFPSLYIYPFYKLNSKHESLITVQYRQYKVPMIPEAFAMPSGQGYLFQIMGHRLSPKEVRFCPD